MGVGRGMKRCVLGGRCLLCGQVNCSYYCKVLVFVQPLVTFALNCLIVCWFTGERQAGSEGCRVHGSLGTLEPNDLSLRRFSHW